MHRSSKRILAPVFLLLAAAVVFTPQARGDGLLNFSFTANGDTWTWTMAQGATPDQGSVAAGDFTFLQVPVFVSFLGMEQTFDMHFFRLPGTTALTTNLIMACDPFRIVFDPINLTCDYDNRVEVDDSTAMWTNDASGNPVFIPGVYQGLVITETPEPSALALLLISFATLSLLAIRVRPSHR